MQRLLSRRALIDERDKLTESYTAYLDRAPLSAPEKAACLASYRKGLNDLAYFLIDHRYLVISPEQS